MSTATAFNWMDTDQISPLSDEEIWRLARTEYDRMLATLQSLDGSDWSKQTDCTAWRHRRVGARGANDPG